VQVAVERIQTVHPVVLPLLFLFFAALPSKAEVAQDGIRRELMCHCAAANTRGAAFGRSEVSGHVAFGGDKSGGANKQRARGGVAKGGLDESPPTHHATHAGHLQWRGHL
jgi:hypothetical protein